MEKEVIQIKQKKKNVIIFVLKETDIPINIQRNEEETKNIKEILKI